MVTRSAHIRRADSLLLLGGLLIVVIGSSAHGQPERRGRPRFSGFNAQPVGVAIISMEEVRKELAITDDQRAVLDEEVSQHREQTRTILEEMRGTFGQSREDLGQRVAEVRKRYQELAAKSDARVRSLLESDQQRRFDQLKVQRMGIDAFIREDIIERLELSDEQQEDFRKRRSEIRSSLGFGRPDPRELEKRRKAVLEQVVAALTNSQKETWRDLTGKQFSFPPPPARRGRPGFAEKRKVVAKFDQDGNGWLNDQERQAAREALSGSGPRRRPRRNREPAEPGPQLKQDDVTMWPKAELYDPSVIRTVFLEFDNPNWEEELEAFYGSDVDVPARITVDGKTYTDVGVHFRGMSSFMGVPRTYKRSLNLRMDLVHDDQRLYGYKNLNLLNANGDASFMSTVLYSSIAQEYLPTPKANFMRVVINGESWGIYTNVQQFDKTFLAEHFDSTKGTRWKVRGNPSADGGLRYLGDDLAPYKARFQMKSNDGEKAWRAFIELCRVLNETPVDQLEAALEPLLNVETALWFLALDVALINSDGYWTRASDYSIFRDSTGRFHVFPHDMNEAFRKPHRFGPRPRRGPGGEEEPQQERVDPGIRLDPLVNANNNRMPLRSRLLAVPKWRAQYLANIRTIAEESLNWEKLALIIGWHRLELVADVESDTKKLGSFDDFLRATADAAIDDGEHLSLRAFFEQRREYLLNYRPADDGVTPE